MGYDGFVRLSESLEMDFFWAFTVMGILEMPADLLTMLSMEFLGRKHSAVWSLIIAGLSAIAMVAFNKGSNPYFQINNYLQFIRS